MQATQDQPALPGGWCKSAVFGFVWTCLVLFVALPVYLSARIEVTGEPVPIPSFGERLFFAFAVFSLAGVLGGPVMSLIGIAFIGRSNGQLKGLTLGVLGIYLLPLVFVDALLWTGLQSLLTDIFEPGHKAIVWFSWLLVPLCLWLNYWLVRRAIRKARASIEARA
jgi:hypothetical protein